MSEQTQSKSKSLYSINGIKKRSSVFIALLLLICGIGYYVWSHYSRQPARIPSSARAAITPKAHEYKTLKNFTSEQFRTTYKTYIFPNTQKISEDTPITGDSSVDHRIKSLAHERGYEIRSAPIVNNFRAIDAEGHTLQQKAYKDFMDLQVLAARQGYPVEVVSGYRSASDQANIFLDRLGSKNPTDAQIIQTLTTTAPPGYSRHHTGYTVDLTCKNHTYEEFDKTPCFKWLSANNYEHTKQFGWIPSYPEGTDKQGPEPESWEYAWVGKDATFTD